MQESVDLKEFNPSIQRDGYNQTNGEIGKAIQYIALFTVDVSIRIYIHRYIFPKCVVDGQGGLILWNVSYKTTMQNH